MTVEDVPERSRYELRDGGEVLGWVEYLPAGRSVIIAHTEVLEGGEGQGSARSSSAGCSRTCAPGASPLSRRAPSPPPSSPATRSTPTWWTRAWGAPGYLTGGNPRRSLRSSPASCSCSAAESAAISSRSLSRCASIVASSAACPASVSVICVPRRSVGSGVRAIRPRSQAVEPLRRAAGGEHRGPLSSWAAAGRAGRCAAASPARRTSRPRARAHGRSAPSAARARAQGGRSRPDDADRPVVEIGPLARPLLEDDVGHRPPCGRLSRRVSPGSCVLGSNVLRCEPCSPARSISRRRTQPVAERPPARSRARPDTMPRIRWY